MHRRQEHTGCRGREGRHNITTPYTHTQHIRYIRGGGGGGEETEAAAAASAEEGGEQAAISDFARSLPPCPSSNGH